MRNLVCRFIRPRLGALHDGELSPAARARTESHVARCSTCAGELAALDRLRAALSSPALEPPEAVWDAFWPQVRARMAAAAPEDAPAGSASWLPSVRLWGPWRLAFGSALAAAALAVLAVLAPWQPLPERPGTSRVAGTVGPADPTKASSTAPRAVVVQSVETADPQSSVMVFTNPESEVTVVWVFGLERTGAGI